MVGISAGTFHTNLYPEHHFHQAVLSVVTRVEHEENHAFLCPFPEGNFTNNAYMGIQHSQGLRGCKMTPTVTKSPEEGNQKENSIHGPL